MIDTTLPEWVKEQPATVAVFHLHDLDSVKVGGPFSHDHPTFPLFLRYFGIDPSRTRGSRILTLTPRCKQPTDTYPLFGFTVSEPNEIMAVLVSTQHDRHQLMGRYFGYADCCVEDFLAYRPVLRNDKLLRQQQQQDWDKEHLVRHWVCPHCMQTKTPQEVVDAVNQKRQAAAPYPRNVTRQEALVDITYLLAHRLIS